MEIPSVLLQRCARAIFLVLALVANLFATSVPLVHALAHEHGHEKSHQGHHAPSHHGEEHDDIHPASLHHECLVVPRAGLDFAVALSPESSLEPIALVVTEAPFVESSALRSRAPPRTAPARAPPLI
jgi:hypothetical protein